MMIMSLRGAFAATKQSPVSRGDCFATCARNDKQGGALREVQSTGGEELSPMLRFGDATRSALTLSPKRSGRKLPIAQRVRGETGQIGRNL